MRKPFFVLLAALLTCVAAAQPAPQPPPPPLFAAITKGDLAAVEKFVAERPELAASKDAKGQSAVMTALFAPRDGLLAPPRDNRILQVLLARKPGLTFFEACAVGDAERVRAMLAADASLAQSWHPIGWSAAHFAAFSGNTEILKRVLDGGAVPDARSRNIFVNTPLHAALIVGQLDTARLLVDRGADVLRRQVMGFAPLHAAALQGRRDIADFLLDHGADLMARANDGRTPVSEAVRGKHAELAAYLRTRGGQDAPITADLAAPPVALPPPPPKQ